ncbi:MAG: molybdopterin dinucleotide binding domain-containing protein [Gemmatimonadaceae bacterium]
MSDRHNAPLRVARLIATRAGDAERGTEVRMRAEDARMRLISDGELVWVQGPRRQELATVRIDDTLPRGDVVLRDVAGASPSEIITLVKAAYGTPRNPGLV